MNLKGLEILLLMKLENLKRISSKVILKKNQKRYVLYLERDLAAYNVKT